MASPELCDIENDSNARLVLNAYVAFDVCGSFIIKFVVMISSLVFLEFDYLTNKKE